MSILLNKLLTGELQIYTTQPKKDSIRTIQNKIKKTRDKKARQCNRSRSYINYINNLKPDFVLAWNMAFDIPYIIQRIVNLGYNPKDIMCHPDFKYKEVSYMIDERNKFNYEERNDFAKISSYSVYLDQMIHFASRRKGQAAIANYRLDYIGQITCGVKKLDYSHITEKLSELPYKDYETFVFYNIIRVSV